MSKAKRATWHLTPDNTTYLKREQARLATEEGIQGLSMNQVLNYILFQWRKCYDPHFVAPTIESIEPSPMGFVYVVGDSEGLFKIGCSRDPEGRRKDLQVGSGRKIQSVLNIPCPAIEMKAIEDSLHARFHDKYVRGEWFQLADRDIEWMRRNFQIGAEA